MRSLAESEDTHKVLYIGADHEKIDIGFHSSINKRYYHTSRYTPTTYLGSEALRIGDVYLADTPSGTRVISKIVEMNEEEATIIDVGGDTLRGASSTGSTGENEYLRYLHRLMAVKILFNHNETGRDQDCETIVANHFSEYLL